MWSEKGTVRGLLDPVIRRYQIPFRVMHGYSERYQRERRGGSDQRNRLCGREEFRRAVLRRLGPQRLRHERVGFPNRLERYSDGTEFELRRVALIESDLAGLPSFKLESKKEDPRFNWYRRNYNPEVCWELDAMKPNDLRERVEDEILGYIDQEKWQRADMVERAERESVREFASALKTLRALN